MKSALSVVLIAVALSLPAAAQIIYLGPMQGGPIDPSLCVPDQVAHQTGLCFANDGVHVSIAGAPFGNPLPLKGDKGDPGIAGNNGVDGKDGQAGIVGPPGMDGKDGQPGAAGPPGKDAVFPTKITLTCLPSTGSVPKGFTSNCTLLLP